MLAERRVSTLCLSPRTFSRPPRWSLTIFKEICASWGKTSTVWPSSCTRQNLQTAYLQQAYLVVNLAMPHPADYGRCHIMFKILSRGNLWSNKLCGNPCKHLLAPWKKIFSERDQLWSCVESQRRVNREIASVCHTDELTRSRCDLSDVDSCWTCCSFTVLMK